MTPASPHTRLMLSLGAAALAGLLTWRALARATTGATQGPVTSVLVLKKNIPAGQVVTAADVDVRTLPVNFAEPGALRERRELGPARARIALGKGEQLTRNKLESDGARLGLAWSVPPGWTAVTLRLSPESAVGGHVLPGDWVAVSACPPRGQARAVLSRVRVGAVQERVWDPSGAPASPAAGFVANTDILVTLLVTADQAGRLISAGEQRRLTLLLLSSVDGGRTNEGARAG